MTNQQTIFAIGIPTINRADLLQETLEKMQNDFPNTAIYVMDNGQQHFDIDKFDKGNVFFTHNDQNLGVSGSWNELLNKIYHGLPCGFTKPCTYALILNDDIYLGKTESQVSKFIVENEFSLATTTGTWCAFILSHLIYKKVGPFDPRFFPAYFEDNDYSYRLKLAGFGHSAYEFLNPVIYRNSMTIQKDPQLNNNFANNQQLYVEKWGGVPYNETFLTPYNKPEAF